MAHSFTEAASPEPTFQEKAAEFESFIEGDMLDDEDETEELDGDEPDDLDDLEEVDEADEPDQPAIEAPVSLNAEEKEVFAQLPMEAQQAWAASETRRNAQVQEATTKASAAQRQAEQATAAAGSQAEADYRARLNEVVNVFAPQMPDPANFTDIRQYQHAKAQYDYAKAQHDTFAQQVAAIGVETPEQKQARINARDAELMAIPEIADIATRGKTITDAFALANEFGYDQQELVESMDARDMKFLAQSAKWKADSEELARIRAKSSERRRDANTGKFRTMRPGSGAAQQRGTDGDKAFGRLKEVRGNRTLEGDAAAIWLEKGGYL